jgi:hypothetical protein
MLLLLDDWRYIAVSLKIPGRGLERYLVSTVMVSLLGVSRRYTIRRFGVRSLSTHRS